MRKNNKPIRRILSLAAALTLMSAYAADIAAADPAVTRIYVSATASGGSGTKDSPFGSLEQALKSAATQMAGMSSGTVEVVLGKGTYRLSQTLEVAKYANGTDKVELAIVGEEGALPKITTSKQLPNDKFNKVTDSEVLKKIPSEAKNSIYQINLRELGITKYGHASHDSEPQSFDLYMDSELMTVAKYPNDDKTKAVDQSGRALSGELIYSDNSEGKHIFTVDVEKERLEKWNNASDAVVFGNLAYGWTTNRYGFLGTLPEKSAITVSGQFFRDSYSENYPWFIENLIEELDAPGEYYLDRSNGILYVYPLGDIRKAVIEYSVDNTDTLSGSGENLIFNVQGVKNVRFENLEISNSVSSAFTGWVYADGSLKIRNCKLKNLYTGFSSWLANNVEISGCEIAYTKNQAVVVQGGDRKTLTPSGSVITNNYIHNNAIGMRIGGAVTITGCGTVLSHNLICDLPHWAVQYGGNDNIIEYNEIYAVLQETADAAVFYCGRDMTLYGNVLQYNYVHDIRRYDGETGIMVYYQDDQASGLTIRNNVTQRTTGGILNGGGRNNTIDGNVFIDGFDNTNMAPLCDARGYGALGEAMRTDFWNSTHGQNMAAVPYDSEIWVEKYPGVKETVDDPERWRPYNTVITNNIYSNYAREKAGDIVPQVRELGTVENNYYINRPLSYEYDERGIIVFTDKSEFEGLGCEWLDTSEIGVLGGNYEIPKNRNLYEEYVVDLAGTLEEAEMVEYPEKQLEIVDLLSDASKLEGEAVVTKSGNNYVLEPGGSVGYAAEKFDSFVLRGKFKTNEEFKTFPIYWRAIQSVGNCWSGNYSYSLWLKADYMELQKWNPGSQVFQSAPSTVKTDGSWNTLEIVANTLTGGGIDLYVNLNGKTLFDYTDYDANKLSEAGYITFSASGGAVEFAKYDATLNDSNQLYTDKNADLLGSDDDIIAKSDDKSEAQTAQNPIEIYIDEKKFKTDTAPYIKNGRTYVPLRAIFEKLGARVEWYGDINAAAAFFDDNRLYIKLGEDYAVLNGEKLYTDAPAELTSNSTMVGARFVSEMLGCDVEWLSEKRIVSIMTPGFESTGALSEKKEPEKEENLTSSEKYKDASEVLLMHRKLPKLYYDIGVVKDGELDGKDINTLVDFSEQKENYYLRTKLPNLSHKLSNQQDRTLNVVFFGSDDTQNGAFVSYISNCMTELFGNRFSFSVECRNGDTSADGADRAAQAMAQHEPDLVFIEFAKGDAAQTAEVSARSMESIIRRIYELNDTTEVVFLYTGEEWSTGARVHDYVAAHYGIPAVFVSNADIGANIDAFFNDMFVNDVAGLSAYDYMSPAYLYKEAAAERESFELGAYIDGAGFSEQKDGSGNTEYLSGTAGDGVSFTFVGIQAGVYVLAESGYIDIYVDGELYKTVSVSDTSTAVKTAVLENGTHTVSFKVSEKTAEENGKITFKSGFAAGILEK